MAVVVYARQARADLRSIAEYIGQESGSREIAKRFLDTVNRRCQAYAAQPQSAELRPELGQGIRCFAVRSYIVFYQNRGDGINVLRVIHGSRDWGSLWEAE